MRFYLKPEFQEHLVIWFLALAIIFGSGYLVLVNHDANFAKDEQFYLALARGDFDVHITFRYRILVPLLAQALALVLQKVLLLTGNPAYEVQVPLGLAFFIVNSLFMSFAGIVLYMITRHQGASRLGSLVGVVAVLTSGYCSYFTGVALSESLYFFLLALLFYAVIARKPFLLLLAVTLGPLAKESFWLFLPFILLSGRFVSIPYLLFQLALGLGLFLGLHQVIDLVAGTPPADRTANALNHLFLIQIHFFSLFSLQSMLAFFSTYGLFYFLLLVGFRKWTWWRNKPGFVFWFGLLFLSIVMVHVLLSGDVGRMWYFSGPVMALAFAKCTDRLRPFLWHLQTQEDLD